MEKVVIIQRAVFVADLRELISDERLLFVGRVVDYEVVKKI